MWIVGSVHGGDLERPGAVYVGRGGRGLWPSPLANAFRLDRSRPRDEQPEVLERYRRLLWRELQASRAVAREIDRLASLPDGVLICFCRPVGRDTPACHADILARAIEWRRGRTAAPADLMRAE